MNANACHQRLTALLTITIVTCCALLATLGEARPENPIAPALSAADVVPGDCALVGRSASAEMQKLRSESESLFVIELSTGQPGNDRPFLSGSVLLRDAPTLQSQAVRLQI